jgi:hypothetical protein
MASQEGTAMNLPPISLAEIVDHARKVPFYQRLYANFPPGTPFEELPVITDKVLLREPLEDTITTPEDISETRYAFGKLKLDSQLVRVLGEDDVDREYDVLNFLLDFTEYEFDDDHRIMLVADEKNNYTMGELGVKLGFWKKPIAAFVVRDHNAHEISEELNRFQPSMLFLMTENNLPTGALPQSTQFLFSINQANLYYPFDNAGKRRFHYFDMFASSLLGLVATKYDEYSHYAYDPQQYHIEHDEAGRLLFTSLVQTTQPLIRYATGDWGKVIDQGKVEDGVTVEAAKFIVTYRGEL